MDIIEKFMNFVNKTFDDAKVADVRHIMKFAAMGILKIVLLYGILWTVTQFVDVSVK